MIGGKEVFSIHDLVQVRSSNSSLMSIFANIQFTHMTDDLFSDTTAKDKFP